MYGKSDGNTRAAQNFYQDKFPYWVAPNPRAFQNLCRNLREYGQFKPKIKTGLPCRAANYDLTHELIRFNLDKHKRSNK